MFTLAVGLGLQLVPPVLAASTTVNLDQWATKDAAWQNGNLNGNNSRYPEGGIVPFRIALEGLKPGKHSIHINYDFTAGGHKAYDFLATWDVTNAKGKRCSGSGGGISSMCPSLPSAKSFAVPVRLVQGERALGERRRSVLGCAASSDDLGRGHHLDQRADPYGLAGRQ